MKLYLFKTMLLLCALVVGSGSAWADDYEKYSGEITEGDYLIVYGVDAMSTTVSSNRFENKTVTITNDVVSNPSATIIWHIAKSGSYYTLYNANAAKYAASTGTKNQAQLLESGTDDKSLWTVSGDGTYEFVNKANKAKNINANLRKNASYGFACYATGTGGALSLYKKVENKISTTTTIVDTAIGNTDIYTNTGSNLLSASVTAEGNPVADATVTWSSSNTGVASIDANGVVTLVAAGTTTITAAYAGNNTYAGSSDTYELTVTDSKPYVQPLEVTINLCDNTFGTSYGGTASGITDDSPVTATIDRVNVIYAGSGNHYINDSQIRFYPNNKLTFSAPEGYIITQIVFTSAGTWAATISANEETYTSSTKTWSGTASSVVFTGSGSSRCDMSKAVVTLAIPSSIVTPTVTVSGDLTLDLDGETNVNAGTLSASVTYEGNPVTGATVTWSSSDDNIATIDASTGAVTLIATGEVTFTATYAGNNDYAQATGTKTVTVIDSNAPGASAENPYTVAQAIEYINTLGSTTSPTEVYVSGIISQVDSYNSTYKSITYWISDDGTTATQMQVYSGKGLDDADFSAVTDLAVGDIVTVKGFVKKYNSTPEFDKNNKLVSFERPVITTPSISLSLTTINATAEGTNGTITVTYNNITDINAEVFFCDAEGNAATYSWVEAEIDADNNVEYTISANEGDARTAYLKVYALDDEANDVYSNLITVTQTAYVAPEAGAAVTFDLSTNIFSLPEGSSNKTVDANDYSYGDYTITLEGSTGNGYYWNTEGYLIMGKTGASLTFPAFDFNVSKIKVYGNSTASGSVKFNIFVGDDAVSTEVTSSKDDHEFEIAAENQAAGTIYTFKVTNNYNAQITKIEIFGYVNVTVTTAEYATICKPVPLDFSKTGIKAYTATDNTTSVKLTKIESGQVPANTPVVLYKAGGCTVDVPVIASAAEVGDNDLRVSTGEYPTNAFVLSKPSGYPVDYPVGFYLWDSTKMLNAGKVYLQGAANAGARQFLLFDDQTTTAVESISVNADDSAAYDLQGRRVMQPTKGLYIVNGKKVVIK